MRLRLDASTIFDSTSRSTDLAKRSVRGGMSTLGGQLVRTVVQTIGTVVLARMLVPSDYGLVAMASVVVALAQVVKDGGLSMATVQRAEVTHPQVSNLFWVNIGASILVAAFVAAIAPLLAMFYGHSELTWLTAALSLTFLLSGVAVQHEALLRRHMRFSAIATAQVLSQACNVAVAVTTAYLGARYWSLVFGTLAGALASSIAIFWFCPWMPGRLRRGAGTRSMLRFGGHVMAFNIMDYFSANSDYILIGRFIGAQPLGLYTRAYHLFTLPLAQVRSPLAAVAVPALSALRDEPERYKSYYRRFVGVLGLFTVPIGIYCVLEASLIIRLLLGDEWMGAVPVFQWLAVAGVIQAVVSTRGLILVSYGCTRDYVWLGASNMVMRVGAVLVGLPFGIKGVAIAEAIGILLFMVPSVWYFTRNTPVNPSDFYRALVKPLAFGLVAGAAAFLLRWLLPDVLVSHLGVLCVFLAIYAVLAYLDKAVRADVTLMVRAWAPPSAGKAEAREE